MEIYHARPTESYLHPIHDRCALWPFDWPVSAAKEREIQRLSPGKRRSARTSDGACPF